MDRKEELLKVIENDPSLMPLIDDMIYLESELDKLRELPKIRIHPDDPSKQKITPAAKMYKEYLQQYTNIVRIITRLTKEDIDNEESPLRKWMKDHVNS